MDRRPVKLRSFIRYDEIFELAKFQENVFTRFRENRGHSSGNEFLKMCFLHVSRVSESIAIVAKKVDFSIIQFWTAFSD
jgi:hypothetical protein